MRTLALTLAISWMTAVSVVHADAINPIEGECPPGLDVAMSGHAEVCSPRACTTDAQCGARAACREIGECWAPREVSPSDGRVFGDSVMRDVPIGLCGAGGACAEGHCATRRQCEPTITTDAWDPVARRWTATPYHAPLVSCAASPANDRSLIALFGMSAALALVCRRRRRFQG